MRLLSVFLAALLIATPAAAQPPVWVVTDRDSELVIFGSVHLLPPGLDWRPAALTKALKTADDVWFETPVSPATSVEAAREAMRRGLLPPDKTLSGLLPPADAARLQRIARTYGADLSTLDRFEPWMAELMLTSAAAAQAGASAEEGVETQVSAAAPARAARRAFETPGQQMAMFDDIPLADQLLSLRESLRELEEEPDSFKRLVRAWMAADVAMLDAEAVQALKVVAPSVFQRLVTDRNARWASALDARLKGKGRTVVVVGVGHLVGAGSVPERLRALGYSVRGP